MQHHVNKTQKKISKNKYHLIHMNPTAICDDASKLKRQQERAK
jgi:hypothetical protein